MGVQAAQDLWASGHWGEALEAALKFVNAKLQENSVWSSTEVERAASTKA